MKEFPAARPFSGCDRRTIRQMVIGFILSLLCYPFAAVSEQLSGRGCGTAGAGVAGGDLVHGARRTSPQSRRAGRGLSIDRDWLRNF